MILKKEFYFIRHGQTDYNTSLIKSDHADISINTTGRIQAQTIAPMINQTSFHTVCCSPLKRAKETKQLLMPEREHQEINDLEECTASIWSDMTSLGKDAFSRGSLDVRNFLEQTKNGLNPALENPGPVLIVAHGGTHWAICYWMNIKDHNWIVDNCQPVHFSINQNTHHWQARKLNTV